MDHEEIRRRVIFALFSDDFLLERLVLKGGNALALVHQLVERGSIDVDLSMAGEFEDLDSARNRVFKSLDREFGRVKFVVFDHALEPVPPGLTEDAMPWWGGYRVTFKLISQERHRELGGNLEKIRIQAHTIDPWQGRTFRVDISKHEWCNDKIKKPLQGRTVYVYSEEMCVVEKFRAICQQMPKYADPLGSGVRPRARDFYDIFTVITKLGVDLELPENLDLFRAIFAAKHVPLELLREITDTREFHRADWSSVEDSVAAKPLPFDEYFVFVVAEAQKVLARLT